MIRNNITEVSYNVQTTVDAKNNIPIDYKVTNQNDSKAMGNMVQRAKSILRTNEFTVLYDKGYPYRFRAKDRTGSGSWNHSCDTCCAINQSGTKPCYNYEFFIYNREDDNTHVPGERFCRTNGTWYKEHDKQREQHDGLSNTKPSMQGPVRHGHSAQDQKRKDSFSEANMQNITRQIVKLTRERAPLQEASGDSGTPLRNDKTAMGIQLHPDKEGDCQGKLRCWIYVHSL